MIIFNKKLKERIALLEKQRKEDSELLNRQRIQIEILQHQIKNPPVFKSGDKIQDFVVLSYVYGTSNLELVNRVLKLFFDVFSKNKVKTTVTTTKPYTYAYKIKNETTNWETTVDEDTLVEFKKLTSKK